MFINNQGHMTKMAAMPIYGKNPSKIFSGTDGLISMKLGMNGTWTIRTLANSDLIRTSAVDNSDLGQFGPCLIRTSATGQFGPRKMEVRIDQ